MLGIIVVLVAIGMVYFKSIIYMVLFCLQSIAFITSQIQPCLICAKSWSTEVICADGSAAVPMTDKLA